jgi:hypothetical protein
VQNLAALSKDGVGLAWEREGQGQILGTQAATLGRLPSPQLRGFSFKINKFVLLAQVELFVLTIGIIIL